MRATRDYSPHKVAESVQGGGRAQPGVSYGRCRGVLTDTGTACNHHKIDQRIGPRTTRYGGRTRARRLSRIGPKVTTRIEKGLGHSRIEAEPDLQEKALVR